MGNSEKKYTDAQYVKHRSSRVGEKKRKRVGTDVTDVEGSEKSLFRFATS